MARMEEGRGAYRIWWGDIREREHLVDLDVDGENNIDMDFKNVWSGRAWIDLAQDWTGQDRWHARSCEHGHKISGFIKCGEFLD